MNTNTDTARPVQMPAATITLGADLSPAVAALEKAWRAIQRRHADVPNVTIIVKRDAKAWGHTTVQHAWAPAGAETPDRFEIMISGENLARGAREVAATLLHEAAHARDLAAGIIDTDTNGRHNTKFKASAELLGLTVAQRGWHGFTDTTLTDEAADGWSQMIALIGRGLSRAAAAPRVAPVTVPVPGVGGTSVTIVAPPKRGDRNLTKAMCACGFSIRASRGVLETAAPTCSVCEEPFQAA